MDGFAPTSAVEAWAHERDTAGSEPFIAVGNHEATKENVDWASAKVPSASANKADGEGWGGATLGTAAGETYDASADIEDIDRRLNALQEFLQAAKTPR